MGDVDCSKWSPYWFDIYFGVNNATNEQNARDFGIKRDVDYKVTYLLITVLDA